MRLKIRRDQHEEQDLFPGKSSISCDYLSCLPPVEMWLWSGRQWWMKSN